MNLYTTFYKVRFDFKFHKHSQKLGKICSSEFYAHFKARYFTWDLVKLANYLPNPPPSSKRQTQPLFSL